MNDNCLALLRLDTQKHMKSAIVELGKVHPVRVFDHLMRSYLKMEFRLFLARQYVIIIFS